jgi:serine/threonine-protein kinase
MAIRPRLKLSPGEVLAGKYRIERVLGEGGMGTVVSARRLDDGSQVAIKCLLPVHRDDPAILARFQREARATSRLTSEHVTRVLESGQIPGGDDEPPTSYLVMEHLEGNDLKSLLERKGTFSVRRAANYVTQACLALAEAHALGIIHRDIKPANLFRTARPDGSGLIKVIDFGIAKFTSPNTSGDRAEMTEVAAMMGSAPFMAPEQMLDARSVDGRADIWALGVVLYQMVSGQKPFVGEDPYDLAMQLLTAPPRPLVLPREHLSPDFEAVVLRCLEKRRENRYPSVVELARALAPFAERPPRSAPGQQMIARTVRLDEPDGELHAVPTLVQTCHDGAASGPKPRAPLEPDGDAGGEEGDEAPTRRIDVA